jgi:MFS family permease
MISSVSVMTAGVLLLLAATSLPELLAGRILQGIGIGAFTGTATASLAELEPRGNTHRAGLTTTFSTAAGIAVGTIASGLFARYLPWPTHLIFAAIVLLLVPGVAGLWKTPETTAARDTRNWRAALRPRAITVGPGLRTGFAGAALAGFCAFAVAGLFSALVPTLAASLLRVGNAAVAGLVVALVFIASGVAQIAASRLDARRAMVAGFLGTAAGLGTLEGAIAAGSATLLLACGIIVGTGNGLTLLGGVRRLGELAPPDRRGQLSSAFWIVAYLGMALPTLGVGLSASSVGLSSATAAFAIFIGGASVIGAICLALTRTANKREEPTERKVIHAGELTRAPRVPASGPLGADRAPRNNPDDSVL